MCWFHRYLIAITTAAFYIGLDAFVVPPTLDVKKPYPSSFSPKPRTKEEHGEKASFRTKRAKPNFREATISPIVQQVELSNGISMQLMASFPNTCTNKPVLLFLHGSFHGAWCWAEHYLPYFVEKGYPSIALSWRGTGGTFAGKNVKKVRLSEHVEDLRCLLIEALPNFLKMSPWPIKNTSPVLICHSFGGLAVMKYLELYCANVPNVRGVVTMCSVPPSGNGKVTLRYLRRSLIASWRITTGFALKKCLTNADLCRTLFFGGPKRVDKRGHVIDHGVSDAEIARYQTYFARDSKATIDILDLSRHLPSKAIDSNGRALFLSNIDCIPFLVAGAKHDYIVDKEALDETAVYFGLDLNEDVPLLLDSPHDVMLGSKWKNTALKLNDWLALTYKTS